MESSNWKHFDFWLLGTAAILTIFGIMMISSSVAGNISLADAAQRQLIFAVVGFAALLGMASLDYHYWSAVNRPLYIIAVITLVTLWFLGEAVLGSARWFTTAIVSIQPSEFAKIVVILVLAEYFAKNRDKLSNLNTVFHSLTLTIGIVIWIFLQPNLSTSIVIMVIWFSLLWVSGLRIKHLLIFIGGGLGVAVAIIPFLQDYQLKRITSFFSDNPEEVSAATYNVNQALISIGSGGLFGKGFGHGSQVQNRFLPVRWSDFIFSATAEELGLVGVLILMLLELFVIYRCLKAARMARDTFGGLICYGVATLIAFQAAVNIGVNLKLMPATGLPLPFISYGGSSLFSLLLGIGLVESVILRHKALEF